MKNKDFLFLKKAKVKRKNNSYYVDCSYCGEENELLYKNDAHCLCKKCEEVFYTSRAKFTSFNYEDVRQGEKIYRYYYNKVDDEIEKYLVMYEKDNNVYSRLITLMDGGVSQNLKPQFTKITKKSLQYRAFKNNYCRTKDEVKAFLQEQVKKYRTPIYYELKKRIGIKEFNKSYDTSTYQEFNKRHKSMIEKASDIHDLKDYLRTLDLMNFKKSEKWLYNKNYRKLHIYLSKIYASNKSSYKQKAFRSVTKNAKNFPFARVIRDIEELKEQVTH